MRLLVSVIRLLLGRGKTAPLPTPPADPERLQRIYRDTHRQVEDLRRAA